MTLLVRSFQSIRVAGCGNSLRSSTPFGKQLWNVRATATIRAGGRSPPHSQTTATTVLGSLYPVSPAMMHPRYRIRQVSRALSSSSSPSPPDPEPPKDLASKTTSDGDANNPTPRSNTSRFVSAGAGLLAAGSLLAGKTKYLLAALKVTKLASLGSMVVSIGAYSMVFGFPYAVGVVGQIALHESGHAYALHKFGIPFSPMVFVPFMGAVIVSKDYPRDAYQDAIVGAAGPVAGTLAAGMISVAGHVNGSQLLIALADFGFMVNLFNMLPVGSMYVDRLISFLHQTSHHCEFQIIAGMADAGLAQSHPILVWLVLALVCCFSSCGLRKVKPMTTH
jgi:hypothetical protein